MLMLVKIFWDFGSRYLRHGRWLSRDPGGENDGPSIYALLRNDGVNKADLLGLKWIVDRKGEARANARATSRNDTFDSLARLIRLDTSDYKKWAKTTDVKPNVCTAYSIPNTIFIDFGAIRVRDQHPLHVISIWTREATQNKEDWENEGFMVRTTEGVIDNEITTHLASADVHGYLFVGHGDAPGTINSYSHLGEDESGLSPDRYTTHGIAFLTLKSCGSASKIFWPDKKRRPRYKYNQWESNVATRGRFVGYTGSASALTELFQWVSVPGKNDKP